MEYLGLYKRNPSPIPSRFDLDIIDQTMVHSLHDTAAYYINPNVPVGYVSGDRHPIFKVYEKYFDSVITVSDTFYLGVTTTSCARYGDYLFKSVPFVMMSYRYNDQSTTIPERHLLRFRCDGIDTWSDDNFHNHSWYIYPILATPDTTDTGITDTTGNDPADTLGIELIGRFTNLFPNPAAHEVTVTSSFGISAIEAYNAAGALVFGSSDSNQLSPSAMRLDVSSWPRGTYLLRIHTPAGTTTKKLIVQ